MREERMYKNESPKISNAQINSQSLSHDDFIVWLFVKSPWQRHSPQLTKMYFFFKSPASELRLPLVSGAPETDSNIRLDSINQDKMEVS